MSQYPVTPQGPGYEAERMEPVTANPDALGLGVLAFVTVLLGCFYASFIIPTGPFTRLAIGAVISIGGIVEVLAGMWAFRRNSEIMASIFTAYGGFLIIVGYLFLSTGILLPLTAAGTLHLVLGLFFLCWAIFAAVLWLGSARVNSMLRLTVALLVLAFLLLAIGHFAFDNIPLLRIGGWIAIICGIVGWVGVAMSVLGIANIQESIPSRDQMQQRIEATG